MRLHFNDQIKGGCGSQQRRQLEKLEHSQISLNIRGDRRLNLKNVIANLRKLTYTYENSAMKFPKIRGEEAI